MNWFLVRKTWVAKVKVDGRQYKTLSSGVQASRKGLKWADEKKGVRVEAERVIHRRIAGEGLEVRSRGEHLVTFDEAATMYKENFNYEDSQMKKIEEAFSGRALQEITSLDIRRFHNMLIETRKLTTWNKYRNTLNAIFNRSIEWRFCEKNPVTAVKGYPENRVKVFLTREQADAYLEEARKESFYMYALILFALKTGRRRKEILSLEWNDIDFGQEQIKYKIQKKKGGHEIHVRKAPKVVFQTLFVLKGINKEKPFPDFPRHAWERIRRNVEKKHKLPDRRFHALRHRCATEMVDNGATLYDVQYYLCHTYPTTTMIYAHISDKRDERITAFLE